VSTRFVDGPAKGRTMLLNRAPLMLRVVQAACGCVNALDKLDDKPQDDELVFLYIMVGPVGDWVFVSFSGRNGQCRGGQFRSATYRLLPGQPEPRHLREREAWNEWCHVHGNAMYQENFRYRTGEQAADNGGAK